MIESFTSYARRQHLTPEADRVLPLVVAAGSMGMNRYQIGSAVDLDRDVLDELLDGLVQMGMLLVSSERGGWGSRAVGVQPVG